MTDKLRRVSTADFSENWIDLESGEDKTEIIRISFKEDLPFISPLFCEKIIKSIMAEISEQITEWQQGKHYERQMTYFDRKAAERVANKIINQMKGFGRGF
ncbi:hypothetical protein [Endozoicomonas ascidiicola]|uniref:hypothetical protein n=1 Tax=Endozoicomonas ascidiicola TaxID=1698521 RepID=UPI0008301E60|nr:hypothetical protein [Endozoicomonas ascidiicola]